MNKILGYEKYTFIVSAIVSFLSGFYGCYSIAADMIKHNAPFFVVGFASLAVFTILGIISFIVLTAFSGAGFYIYDKLILKKEFDDFDDCVDNYFPNDAIGSISLICGALIVFVGVCWVFGSFMSCVV